MSNRSRTKSQSVESSIPNWVAYALLATFSLLIAKSINGGVAILTASGIVMMLTLFYMSKPVAEIQPAKEKNIFDKNKINRSTWKNPSEPNAQRKRYLKTLDKETRRAA
tara:strand:- start:189 stop:515 length:327 start_codon:yes stop_codon:yes gene_type:complete